MRTFKSGAIRDSAEDKPDYEGYLSPLVIQRFGEYMRQHSVQADGKTRASDNWQLGIPQAEYIKSGWRHFLDWWLEHRGHESKDGLEEALCALLFNVSGYLHETLKAKLLKAKTDEILARRAEDPLVDEFAQLEAELQQKWEDRKNAAIWRAGQSALYTDDRAKHDHGKILWTSPEGDVWSMTNADYDSRKRLLESELRWKETIQGLWARGWAMLETVSKTENL